MADGSFYVPLVEALGIGVVAGAGTGLVVGARKGMILGALVGAIGAIAGAYLLSGEMLASREVIFPWLTAAAALGCGLIAGFFFGFSALVMIALGQQPPASGMAAMQTINVAVFNPWFGVAFVGTPAACVLAMIAALLQRQDPGAVYTLVGGALYLVGTLWVTALCNVPRNDALAAVPATASTAADLWSRYLHEWTIWNHVRAAGAFLATAALIIALIVRSR
jgi:uncharacterized membrane protein